MALATVLCAAAALAACDTTIAPSSSATLAVGVAPLTLSGLTDAEYLLTVTNGHHETVVTRTLTSRQYGPGDGSLSYVSPCDADDNPNTVALTLVDLWDGPDGASLVDRATYRNPGLLTRDVTCTANADVAVTFDLTVVRQANQGFFDVAVSFKDVFCSAKLDCLDDDGAPLTLLHNPLAGGQRDLTAVMAFACTGGPAVTETYLYLDDPTVHCTGLTSDVSVDASALGTVDLSAEPNANPGSYLFGAAVYRGREELLTKAYWNLSFGLNRDAFPTSGDCTLHGRATASATPFTADTAGFALPAGAVYPVITWAVPISRGATLVCGSHAINDEGGQVATTYLGNLSSADADADPVVLQHELKRSTGAVRSGAPAAPALAPVVLDTPGETVVSLPAGEYLLAMWGAAGGPTEYLGALYPGGGGGYAEALYAHPGGDVVVWVGEGGAEGDAPTSTAFGGGAPGGASATTDECGGGGGLSGVFLPLGGALGSGSLSSRAILLAGGGGGRAGGASGGGGGASGGSATTWGASSGGGGGTQIAGGTPGQNAGGYGTDGLTGAALQGGLGGTGDRCGGGGGGGWFGGGGGGSNNYIGASGGGGSGYGHATLAPETWLVAAAADAVALPAHADRGGAGASSTTRVVGGLLRGYDGKVILSPLAGRTRIVDDFDGAALDARWSLVRGTLPTYTVSASRLQITNASPVETLTTAGLSWVTDRTLDRANQWATPAPLGTGDFDLVFQVAGSSTSAEITYGTVALTDANDYILMEAGFIDGTSSGLGGLAAHPTPTSAGAWNDTAAASASGWFRISRTAGMVSIWHGDTLVAGPVLNAGPVAKLAIVFLRGGWIATLPAFGTFEVHAVRLLY